MMKQTPHVAVPVLGPKPQGDPDAMREMAASLRAHGPTIKDSSTAGLAAVKGMTFHAPFANRVRGRVEGNQHHQAALADHIADFAAKLERAADDLAVDLRLWGVARDAVNAANDRNAEIDRANVRARSAK